MGRPIEWETRLSRWLEPFLEVLQFKKRRKWAPVYAKALLLPGERKSIEPMAARVAPGHEQELRHFISESKWDDDAVERVLWDKVDEMLGGDESLLIVDDTALPKKGEESVGVAYQYCGALGKQANCQSLVSLTLARDDVPAPVSLRLYLPEVWASDSKRRAKVGVPKELVFRQKWRIAIDEIKRLKDAGVRFGTVLADAGYGTCGEFRNELTELGFVWAVGVLSNCRVYPANVSTRMPRPQEGPPRKHPLPSHPVRSVAEAIQQLGPKAFRKVTWRSGTKGALSASFAMRRVCLGDGGKASKGTVLPGTEVWLVCEQRSKSDLRYYVTNHPANVSKKTIAIAIKARWACEQAHQQLKEELGLDHFEGRSWRGLHHHALLNMICFAFLQRERLRENKSKA